MAIIYPNVWNEENNYKRGAILMFLGNALDLIYVQVLCHMGYCVRQISCGVDEVPLSTSIVDF